MEVDNSRRKFLKISSISLAAIGTGGLLTFLKRVSDTRGFDDKIDGLIHHAFRLTDHNSLLNLEFYFINCKYERNKIWAKYGPHENYMVVRLPQQHIAENSFEDKPDGDYKAVTYIAGYSYLVFRILFPEDKFFKRLWTNNNECFTSIDLKKECLLDWGNEEKFRLVVRQDLTESLFQLKKIDYYLGDTAKIRDFRKQPKYENKSNDDSLLYDSLENYFPFQINSKNDLERAKLTSDSSKIAESLRFNRIPKVYGDPVTAIELPWRLIINPKLPDSSKYKFKWDIPETDLGKIIESEKGKHKLWTATLSIEERTDKDYYARKENDLKNKSNPNNSAVELDQAINQLELMILGSPDHLNPKSVGERILPSDKHRDYLVSLYIQLKIIARTDSLTFSPLGASVKIHLKNNQLEKALAKGIPLIEWNQIISLGRDEKVEVSTLFLEAEFGHKMAFIETAQRELRKGRYPLIKRQYIVPLDIEKDYTRHINQKSLTENRSKLISKFGSPFKKITFLEISPKESKAPFNPLSINFTKTEFEFHAIDWQENTVKFKKQINAVPFGFVFSKIQNEEKLNEDFLKFISETTQNVQTSEKAVLKFSSDSSKIVFKNIDAIKNENAKIVANNSLINLDTLLLSNKDSLSQNQKNLLIALADLENQKQERIIGRLEVFFDIFKNIIFAKAKTKNITVGQIKEYINAQLTSESFKNELIRLYIIKNKFYYITMARIFKELGRTIEILVDANLKTYFVINGNSFIEFLKYKFYFNNSDELLKVQQEISRIINEDVFDYSPFRKLNIYNQTISDLIIEFNFINELKEWISTDFKKAENGLNFELYTKIQIEFPEIIDITEDLKLIFNKLDKDLLLQNLKSKLILFYDFQEKLINLPNIIILQKQKIGFAVVEKIENKIKRSLSELETEYIIFQGALKKAANQEFDFFHEYAIMPQVTQAKVYVSAINKLIGEDISISINYATEYLENQIDELKFEVGQNASMVFAEVQQFSRDQIKGLAQKLGDKMPGINVEFPAHYLTYLKHPDQAKTDFLKNVDGLQIPKDLQNASRDLVFISEEIKDTVRTIEDLKAIDPKKYFKDFGAKLFGSISLENILGIGFDPPRLTEFPDRIIYQFSNDKFQENRAAFVSFKPVSGKTKLDLLISKSLKNSNEYFSYISLNDFSIGVIIGEVEVLTVYFNRFKITSSPGQPKKTDISIGDVKLGGPLQFIADIAAKFMAPGNGMQINAGSKHLEALYGISLPDIAAPAFNFKNLQFKVGLNVPYDPDSLQPISFNFGLNSKDDKFLVSAGIYGGRGHFMIKATPKGIEQIDIAIEMGAYASINLGIGKGEVFLFFGLWFVSSKGSQGENNIKAVAYVLCSGSAIVLGFITIGVSVLIALTYIKRGSQSLFYGEAVVTYSVKVAFFKKTFSIRYQREFAGSLEGDNTTGTSQQEASFLNLFAFSSPNKKNNKEIDTDKTFFQDVFEDEKILEEYIDCFN